jgi:hypothetical protein
MNVRVVFPTGGGGNWLDDVVWHLERGDTTPTVIHNDNVFDAARNSSILFDHALHIPDPYQPDQVLYYPARERNLVFSTDRVFNIYVNHANKYLYRRTDLATRSTVQQLFELSNCARYHFSYTVFWEQYCKHIDLDSALIVQDPEQFVTQLFACLDSIAFKYTANREYVLSSIDNYLATCENVNHIHSNWGHLLWLAACHAITVLDNLQIPVILPDSDITQIAQCLMPHQDHCVKRIQPWIAFWQL